MCRLTGLKSMPGGAATPHRAQGPDPYGVPGHTGSAPMLGASSAAESKGALPGRGCPHATSTHSITPRSRQGELHHLCLYIDSASFSLTPPAPLCLSTGPRRTSSFWRLKLPPFQPEWGELPLLGSSRPPHRNIPVQMRIFSPVCK